MPERILIALTLCVVVGFVTYSHVSAAEHTSGYEDVFDFGLASMESDEIRSTFVISNHGNDTLKIKNAGWFHTL